MKFKKIQGAQNHNLFRPYDRNGELRATFWVRFFRTGKGRLEESLKTEALGEARIARDIRIAEFLGTKPKFRGGAHLVGDKFPEFVELKRGKSKATYDSIKNQWEKHLKEYFEAKLIDEVTGSEWLRYVAWKRAEPGMADRKFFNDRKYLSMFLHWLHRDGLLAKVPRLEDVDPTIDAGRVFADDEIEALLTAAQPDLKDQIQMALTMGMRHGEIWSLEWAQVNLRARTIHLPAHKTKIREARTFAMSEIGEAILKRRRASSESDWVFPHSDDPSKPAGRFGEKSAWDKARIAAGVEGRFHDLRHTFLTRAFKKAVNPALICAYAGLSLEEADRTYLHFDEKDTEVVASLVGVTWR